MLIWRHRTPDAGEKGACVWAGNGRVLGQYVGEVGMAEDGGAWWCDLYCRCFVGDEFVEQRQ